MTLLIIEEVVSGQMDLDAQKKWAFIIMMV